MLVKKTDIPKPALAHQDKPLIKNALMTPLILINASAAPTSYLAHHPYKVQGLAAAANINPANARLIINLAIAELPPEPHLVRGTASLNTQAVKLAVQIPAHLEKNPSPAIVIKAKKKYLQPNAALLATNANAYVITNAVVMGAIDI